MTEIATAGQMRAEAHDLMEQALRALDCAGEPWAAHHLDLAIETLGLRSPDARLEMFSVIASTPLDNIKRALPIDTRNIIAQAAR